MKINNVILINNPILIPGFFSSVGKDVRNTIELNNVILTYQEFQISDNILTEADKKERDWLYKEIDSVIEKIRKDRYTRQAIFYNLYESGLEHNCLSLFHLYFRENRLNLNVYVRSMNYDGNFGNDLNTFTMLLNKACNELMLDKGQITVFIMSLHRFK